MMEKQEEEHVQANGRDTVLRTPPGLCVGSDTAEPTGLQPGAMHVPSASQLESGFALSKAL